MIAKRLGLVAGAILVSLLLLELGTRTVHRLREGEPFPADALRERLAPAADLDRLIPEKQRPADDRRGPQLSNKVIHPYLGYVFDHTGQRSLAPDQRSVNRFGFPGIDPLTTPAADEIRVAIAGGSVALQLFNDGGDALKQHLAAAPAFHGKRIELVALTLGGFKQPQQLMALTWLLALGAHFDVVINLDGFNEVVLPKSDNVPAGVHPSFPRSWEFYQTKALDAGRLAYVADTRRLLEQQRDLRRSLGTGLPSHSAVALTILDRLDSALSEQIAERDAAFRERLNRAGLGYQATGPFLPYPNDAALFEDMVALWRASSMQMHQLTAGAGGRYFHFLQPNQWVKGAKPLSGIERNKLNVRGPFMPRTAVPQGYPLLIRAGAELRRTGVSFRSLVPLFQEEQRTVYRDTCCHFNALGIAAIAAEVARVVSQETP